MTALQPAISIIIPARDPGYSLDQCLAMLDDQETAGLGEVEIVLIDDASSPALDASIADSVVRHRVQLLRLSQNAGRAAARNIGARAASGRLLVFIDSDCVPQSERWLQAHAGAIAAGAIAATGPMRGDSSGFWDRYQQQVSARRQAQHAGGSAHAGTTASMAVRADAFERLGGFDEAYAGYGFEDRDLLLRLAQLGDVAWIDEPVRHLDALRLVAIRRKFIEAGGSPSRLFHARHPDAYRSLGYARCDARLHPLLGPLAMLAGPLSAVMARVGDWSIGHGAMPFALGRLWVKATTALAFMAGSRRSPAPRA